jgi:uncharacterized protein with HEPN domain
MSKDHLERNPKIYLTEIIRYIGKVEKFTQNLTREDFLKDEIRIYAVDDLIRNIGEAFVFWQKIGKSKHCSTLTGFLM